MVHRTFSIALVLGATLWVIPVPASADTPSQVDIDRCKKEAAAAVAGPNVGALSGGGTTGPMTNGSVSTAQQATEPTVRGADQAGSQTKPKGGEIANNPQPGTSGKNGGSEGLADPAARQAFAACLAKHGYYKGYYR